MKVVCTSILLLIVPFAIGISQEAVFLTNPSFEGTPQHAAVPAGWRNCAFNNESPPDIHPVLNSTVGMSALPYDGESFLGLLAKNNASVESIGQRLDKPLQGGVCYSFSIALSKSDRYYIIIPEDKEVKRFDGALVLRVWGGTSPCGHKSLLAISPPIKNADWKKNDFRFRPKDDIDWISFEAYFVSESRGAYAGNLMIDDASPFIPIDCASKSPLVDVSSLIIPKYEFVKYHVPDNVKEEVHWAVGDRLVEYLNFRVVEKKEDTVNLIFDNCNKIGFEFSSRKLIDRRGYAIKEIASNVLKFRSQVLVIGIPLLDKRLNKLRIKRLKRTFREIGLPPKHYRIDIVNENTGQNDWLCGQKEIWLKLEDL